MNGAVGAHISGREAAGGGFVITYHYVRPVNSDGVTGITAEEFGRQLELVRETHRIVGVDEFVDQLRAPRGDSRGKPLALITFDDAVKDQYQFALPVLERMGVPAVFFAPMRPVDPGLSSLQAWTPQHLVHALAEAMGWSSLERAVRGEIGNVAVDSARMNSLYHYEAAEKRWLKFVLAFVLPAEKTWAVVDGINRCGPRLKAAEWFMSAEELADLQRRGHAIGAHGYDHLPYSTLTPLEQAWDMGRAARIMSRLLGGRKRAIAYPFGRHDETTRELVRAFGYTHAFTTEERVDCKFLEEKLRGRRAA
jgi:peptidoglycan/xylan/chitin deacetylase (PgdA/CDA1 family)